MDRPQDKASVEAPGEGAEVAWQMLGGDGAVRGEEAVLDDGDEDVDRDGDPNLGLHGIFGCPEETFGAQMLFD